MTETDTIKRRLKRKEAWQHNYLDDLVTSTMRSKANQLSNKGPRAQCNYLLQNGWTIDEIVEEGRRVRRLIRKHMSGLVPKKHKHKHK